MLNIHIYLGKDLQVELYEVMQYFKIKMYSIYEHINDTLIAQN